MTPKEPPRLGEPNITSHDDVVEGSDGVPNGKVQTLSTAEEMLASFNKVQNKHNMVEETQDAEGDAQNTETRIVTKKVKSVRYVDVPYFPLHSLDMESVRSLFDPLDFTESERQIAGALVSSPHKTDGDIAKHLGGTAVTPIRRVRKIIEGDRDPTEKQEAIIKYARENPDMSPYDVSKEMGAHGSYVKYLLRSYRHSRVEITVEEPIEPEMMETSENEETGVNNDSTSDEGEYANDKTNEECDTVQTQTQQDGWQDEIENINERLDALDEQMAKGENKWRAVQSLTDRALDNMVRLERFVEENLDGNDEDTKRTLNALKEDVDAVQDRLDTVGTSLKTHKDAITELREGGGTGEKTSFSNDFNAEERREIVKSVAKSGNDDLLDTLLNRL